MAETLSPAHKAWKTRRANALKTTIKKLRSTGSKLVKVKVPRRHFDILKAWYVDDFTSAIETEKGKNLKPATKAFESFNASSKKEQRSTIVNSALAHLISERVVDTLFNCTSLEKVGKFEQARREFDLKMGNPG
jgi:hypothetical protein